jgi:hypothetical protein
MALPCVAVFDGMIHPSTTSRESSSRAQPRVKEPVAGGARRDFGSTRNEAGHPGNIGVAEFGLTIGLVSAGMTDEAALAAVLLYRIATYYLPPLWGFFAMLWLQRNRYL